MNIASKFCYDKFYEPYNKIMLVMVQGLLSGWKQLIFEGGTKAFNINFFYLTRKTDFIKKGSNLPLLPCKFHIIW